MMKNDTQEEDVGVTWVFWDISMCPVPFGCDPRVVRGCIKRILEKNGYDGPLTVTAYGKLGDFSTDMLRGLYSSGIALTNVPHGSSDIVTLINPDIPPPVNVMLISDRNTCPGYSQLLQMWEYNPIEPFPYYSLEYIIMEDFTVLLAEEEEFTGELPFWDCLVCRFDPPGQGFENFITHLHSEEHHELMLTRKFIAPPCPLVEREGEEGEEWEEWEEGEEGEEGEGEGEGEGEELKKAHGVIL